MASNSASENSVIATPTTDSIGPPSRPVTSTIGLSRYLARLAAFIAKMVIATFSSEPGLAVVNARHGRNRGGLQHVSPYAATGFG
jgi:hypothetical protein